jgi:hypothetical protein
MSVQVTQTGTTTAALYCNTEDVAFGPVFPSQYDAEDFLDWLTARGDDARDLHNNGTLADTIDLWWQKQDGEPA